MHTACTAPRGLFGQRQQVLVAHVRLDNPTYCDSDIFVRVKSSHVTVSILLSSCSALTGATVGVSLCYTFS